jgi:hypothetical protein
MRSAISPDRSALPLSKLDNVGRETRNAIAAAALPALQPPIAPGVFRFPSMRGLFLPATPAPDLNFFFYRVPPLYAALWQSRSEPVKGVR